MTDGLVRPADLDIDAQLTSQEAIDRITAKLRAAAFDFEPDDLLTIATGAELQVTDGDAYRQGYEVLEELANLDERIKTHYARFDRPLLTLTQVVRSLKNPHLAEVATVKTQLAKRLGTWKAQRDEADRREQQARQDAQDAAARASQQAKAATLARIAEAEPDPKLADAFRHEAEQVAAVEVHAAPVDVTPSVPKVAGGSTRTTWKCQFDDVKALMRAWVEGRCHLSDEAIIAGLQSSMDKQAGVLQGQLGKAFPGCTAVPSYTGIKRRGVR